MNDSILWPKTITEAKAIQISLRDRVRILSLKKRPHLVAGVDAAFDGDRVIGAACLYRYPEGVCIEETWVEQDVRFPYVPGFLSFREAPVILDAIARFGAMPDVFIIDGHGIAHPLRFGIASHIGVLLDKPTIGCAKSRLCGEYEEPPFRRGTWSTLLLDGEPVGAVVRTRDGVRPLFVSPGHRIDLEDSIDTVLMCLTKYRLPEPLRKADSLSKKMKRRR